MKDSWPQLSSSTVDSNTPRRLLPVSPPPEPLLRPSVPSPARKPIFDAPYILSTHIFPAAHLRTTEYVRPPLPPPANATKAQRQAYANAVTQKLKDLHGALKSRGTKQILWNCANRYVRVGLDETRANGVTLFFAHGGGFPKEIWEPVLQHLLSSPAASLIDEVWSWESVQHGDACLINADKNGGIFDWADDGRDILNFFNFFLPTKASASSLPTHLTRVPAEESAHRQKNSFRHRTLIAAGHSYGGCTITLAALTQPKLFSSIIFIDPFFTQPTSLMYENEHVHDLFIRNSITRRETWNSKEEALSVLSQSPFFSTWDPAVLNVYIECGTYDTTDPVTGKPMIRLKMPGMQEAVVFAGAHIEYEVYRQLPVLDERIELRWIVPGRPSALQFVPHDSMRKQVWVRQKNASNTIIPNADHFIVQETPQALARDIQEFLQSRYIHPRIRL